MQEGNTGLHWACVSGCVDTARAFIAEGCQIDEANENGDRPLSVASTSSSTSCCVESRGVSVSVTWRRGAIIRASCNSCSHTALTSARSTTRTSFRSTYVTYRHAFFPAGCKQCVWITVLGRGQHCAGDARHKSADLPSRLQVQATRKAAAPVRTPRLPYNSPLLFQSSCFCACRDISRGKERIAIPILNGIDDERYPDDYHYVKHNVQTKPMHVNCIITSLEVRSRSRAYLCHAWGLYM